MTHAELSRYISIHALREEGDQASSGSRPALCHFYPRPPRGGRLLGLAAGVAGEGISIHALREEGDAAAARLLSSVS